MSGFLSDFKAKYIKHLFIYKLYRVLKYRSARSHGQWGEDIIISRIFKNGPFKDKEYKGVFVDVGCNHPIVGNNTYKLYKMGWRGLNIDLTQENITLCQRLRRRDISLQRAISEESEEIESYIFDPGSGLNTLDKDAAEFGARLIDKPYKIEKIVADTLTNTILETLGDCKIDVLNIDVEGHELSVLKSFDFNRFSPDVIVCEIHAHDLEEVAQTEVYKLIKEHEYHCASYCGATAIFAKNDLEYIL